MILFEFPDPLRNDGIFRARNDVLAFMGLNLPCVFFVFSMSAVTRTQ